MAMIFKFTVLSDENDNFVRDYEVEYDMPLVKFHEYICCDLRYDPKEMVSLFTSNREWEKVHEYTLLDMEEPESTPMEGVSLSQLIHENHDRLIYQFDPLGERCLFMELMETHKKDPDAHYPRCTVSEGAAPDQYEPSQTAESGSIFDDVMADFNDFEGDENYDDD